MAGLIAECFSCRVVQIFHPGGVWIAHPHPGPPAYAKASAGEFCIVWPP